MELRSLRLTTISLFVIACLVLTAHARIVEIPPWVANPNNPTYAGGSSLHAEWDFTRNPTQAQWSSHNFPITSQPPSIAFPPGSTYPDVVIGPTGNPIPTWHVGSDGEIEIFVPNSNVPRPFKDILLQITSDKGSSSVPTANGTPGTPSSIAGFPGGSAWYTYGYKFHLEPNPPFEIIKIPAVFSTNVDQIVIDTICYTPEPAALSLVAFALPLLLRRR